MDNLTLWWEHYLSFYDKLALQHAHRACETYRFAQASETAQQHIQELCAVYTKTLTANKDYRLLVTNLPKEHIETQRLKTAYTTMCMERRQWYDHAKHDTMCQYADMKLSLLSYERFVRMRTDTAVLLTCHTQQALYTLLQQERIIQLTPKTAKSC